MKPVEQTIFGDKVGNCFAACIASLLELPLEVVPNFCADQSKYWMDTTREWLKSRGYTYIEVRYRSEAEGYLDIADGSYLILSGKSPRGNFKHSVIGQVDGAVIRIAHDPHPTGQGLDSAPEWLGFIVQQGRDHESRIVVPS